MSLSWTAAATWLLHCALGGGLLLLLTWAWMRRTPQPARRQRLGEWGVAAALAVAVLSAGPAWLVVSIPAAPAPAAAPEPLAEAPLPPDPDEMPGAVLPFEDPAEAHEPVVLALMLRTQEVQALLEAEDNSPPWWQSLLVAVPACLVGLYAAAALLLLGRWVLGYVGLRRLLRGAAPAPEAVARLFGEMASAPPPRLLVSSRLRVPISFGLLRPTVVLPEAMCRPPAPDKLRWVFAHELTHLERRDAWSALLFALGQAVYFYLPWFWSVKRQVRLCQEYVADAAAVVTAEGLPAGGHPPSGGRQEQAADYVEFLLSLSGAPAVPAAATGVTGTTSDLFRRATMLLQEPIRVEKRCPRRWALKVAGGLFTLAFVVAGVGLRADAAPQQIIIIRDGQADVIRERPADVKKFKILVAPEPGHDEKGIVIIQKKLGDGPAPFVVPLRGEGPAAGKRVVRDVLIRRDGDGPPKIEIEIEGLRDALKKLPAGADGDAIRKAIEDALKKVKAGPGRPGGIDMDFDFGPRFAGGAAQAVDMAALKKMLDALQGNPTPEDVMKAVKAFREANQKVRPGQGMGGQWAVPGFGSRAVGGAARLGVQVEKPAGALADQLDLPRDRGLVVTKVNDNTPAAKAGLKANDVLLEVGGKAVPNDTGKFNSLIDGVTGKTDLLVLRKGKRETVRGVELPAGGGGGGRGGDWTPMQWQQWQFPGGMGQMGGGGPGAVMTTTLRNADRFTTRHQEGSLIITVTGTVEGGKAKFGQASVQDGNASNSYDSLDRVPAQYRDRINHLLQISGGTTVRSEPRQ